MYLKTKILKRSKLGHVSIHKIEEKNLFFTFMRMCVHAYTYVSAMYIFMLFIYTIHCMNLLLHCR